jgi:uncharacterized protein YraI
MKMTEQYRFKGKTTSNAMYYNWSEWVDRYDENGKDWWYNATYLQYEFRGRPIKIGDTVRLANGIEVCPSLGTVATVSTDQNGYHMYQAVWDDFPNDDNYYVLGELVVVL